MSELGDLQKRYPDYDIKEEEGAKVPIRYLVNLILDVEAHSRMDSKLHARDEIVWVSLRNAKQWLKDKGWDLQSASGYKSIRKLEEEENVPTD